MSGPVNIWAKRMLRGGGEGEGGSNAISHQSGNRLARSLSAFISIVSREKRNTRPQTERMERREEERGRRPTAAAAERGKSSGVRQLSLPPSLPLSLVHLLRVTEFVCDARELAQLSSFTSYSTIRTTVKKSLRAAFLTFSCF